MKKLFTLMSLAAIALAVPTSSFAADKKTKPKATPDATAAAATPAPAPAATPAPTKPIPMNSVVATIDPATKTFTHKNKDGKEVKFEVTDKTEIKNNGVDAKFEDIKVGDRVDGSRIKKGENDWEIVKITKFGVPPPKAPKTAPAASATPKPKK